MPLSKLHIVTLTRRARELYKKAPAGRPIPSRRALARMARGVSAACTCMTTGGCYLASLQPLCRLLLALGAHQRQSNGVGPHHALCLEHVVTASALPAQTVDSCSGADLVTWTVHDIFTRRYAAASTA